MFKRMSNLAVASAIVAVAACGGGDDGPSFTTAADSATMEMLAESAFELAGETFNSVFLGGEPGIPFPFAAAGAESGRSGTTMALMYLERARRMAELRHPGQLPAAPAMAGAMLSAPFSTCEPTETGVDELGDPIDTDNDGVPDNYTLNFGSACVEEDSAGTYRYTYSGSINFKDTNIGLYSFSATINRLKMKYEDLTAGGDGFSFSVNGSESFNVAAALASHALNWSEVVSFTSSGTTASLTLSDNETATFDPDAGLSIAMDAPLPNGVFDYSADYRIVGENSGGEVPGNFRIVLDTPTPLHYNSGCVSDIDAGVFRGLLSGSETVGFTATWSGCGDPVFDLFGYTNPAVVAAR